MVTKKVRDMSKDELMREYEKTVLLSTGDVSSTEEAQAKAIVQLTESPDPEVLTHLTDIEIKRLSSLSAVADLYGAEVVQTWIKKFIRLRISLQRKGRQEIVEIAKRPKIEQAGFGAKMFGR